MFINSISCSIEKETELRRTLSGTVIPPLKKGLPLKTSSLCPECLTVISAELYEEAGKVYMTKECANHGVFKDIISSDVKIYRELERWHFSDGVGFSNPHVTTASHCPTECGICNMHITHTSIANVDITSRCNLKCSICFADSNQYIHEPSYNDVFNMLQRLRQEKPAPCTTVQFTGGEPTIHPQFFDIVRLSKELGFTHIQVATNGIKLSEPDFAMKARQAGLQYIYLQMDGVTDDVYEKMRGKKLLDIKLKVIESARKAGLRVIFVPTIIRGVNNHQIGDIIRLAFENLDVLTGISLQPVTFTGRFPEEHRLKERYTLADMIHDVSAQTGFTDPYRDWFSLNSATPFVKFAEALTGSSFTNHTCHPHCGAMTHLFVDSSKNAVPITRFLNLFDALKEIDSLALKTEKTFFKKVSELKVLHVLYKYFKAEKAPQGLSFIKFLKTLDGYADKKYTWNEKYQGHTYKTFFIFGMHFMDDYNYDLQRIRRCGVHYSAQDGRIYPFCTYNAGYTFRKRIEKHYGIKKG